MTFYKVALSGAAGAGKDTIAAELHREHHILPMSLAQPMKELVSQITGLSLHEVEQVKAGKNGPEQQAKMRRMLQLIGTEVGRGWDEDIWVNQLLRRIRIHERAGLRASGFPRGAVVTDCRFRNEFDALRADGFLMVDVKAPIHLLRVQPSSDPNDPWNHASERDLDSYRIEGRFDVTLNNDRVAPVSGLARQVIHAHERMVKAHA